MGLWELTYFRCDYVSSSDVNDYIADVLDVIIWARLMSMIVLLML